MIRKHLIQLRFGIWQMFLSKNPGKGKGSSQGRMHFTTKTTRAAPAASTANPCATCVRRTYCWRGTNLVFCKHFQIQTTKIFEFLVLTAWFSCSYWKVEILPLRLTITTRWNPDPSESPRGFLCRRLPPAGLGTEHTWTRALPFQLLRSEFTLQKRQPMEQNAESIPRRWKQNPPK